MKTETAPAPHSIAEARTSHKETLIAEAPYPWPFPFHNNRPVKPPPRVMPPIEEAPF